MHNPTPCVQVFNSQNCPAPFSYERFGSSIVFKCHFFLEDHADHQRNAYNDLDGKGSTRIITGDFIEVDLKKEWK